MDQIIGAIMAALPTIAAQTATSAVKDAYEAFKRLVQRKWGEKGDIANTLKALEQAPDSKDLAKELERHVAEYRLNHDSEIMQMIRPLIDALVDAHTAPTGPSANFEQSGGTFTGVGAIANNKGDIRFR